MLRLRSLYLNNNRVSAIAGENMTQSLPNLETLVLTNNLFKDLDQLESLQHIITLRHLSLLDNMVTKRDHYRLYVIHLLPSLRYLDYKKVKRQVRKNNL